VTRVRPPALRWKLAEQDAGEALFADETAVERHMGTGAYAGLEFLHVNARSIINPVPASSRMAFRYSVNPYRGCSHACPYCFARPTHEYLGLNAGRDFERRIVVKVNAVERLRAELRSPRWRGEHIAMGTNTDPYQHAEGKYHLTRGIVEELGRSANPFSILTKSTLVLRDLPLLTAAAARTSVRLNLSIGTLDRSVWRCTEPGTPPPEQRLRAVRRLNEAGIPCGVLVAPVLPGLSDRDDQVRAVVEACVEAGAVSVTAVPLHLRPGVRQHYLGWLAAERPDLLALHRRRFARGFYQPQVEAERISAIVRSVVERSPSVHAPALNTRGVSEAHDGTEVHDRTGAHGRAEAPVGEAYAGAEQLRLL
jgi:DNA repair photolyase